jgi:hypothetical protein
MYLIHFVYFVLTRLSFPRSSTHLFNVVPVTATVTALEILNYFPMASPRFDDDTCSSPDSSDSGYQLRAEKFDVEVVPSIEEPDPDPVGASHFLIDGPRSRDSDTPGSLVDFIVRDSYCSDGVEARAETTGSILLRESSLR